MKQKIIFIFVAFLIVVIDQIIKILILNCAQDENPILQTRFIDIILVFNKGVAFSLGSFLGESLKWILLFLLFIMTAIIIKSKDFFDAYYIPLGVIIGAGFGNLIDRFIREGVVDYIYWHFGINFAVFNFADSMINISIAYILLHYVFLHYKNKSHT